MKMNLNNRSIKLALCTAVMAALAATASAQTQLYGWNFDNATGSGTTLTVAPSYIDGSMTGGTLTNTIASGSISSSAGSGVSGLSTDLGLVQTQPFGSTAGSLQAQVGNLSSVTAFTVGIWFNYNASVTSFSALGSSPRLFDIQTATGSDGNELYLALNTGTNLQVGVNNTGTRPSTAGSSSPFGAAALSPATMTNTWFFVGLSYTTAAGGTASLYTGTIATPATFQYALTNVGNISWSSTTNFISIGNNAGFGTRDLPGTIDNASLYSGAGDQTFIQGIQSQAIPVPEPSTAMMIGFGGLALVTVLHRRRK